jgi:methanogenic corrinoid protein MtbC1
MNLAHSNELHDAILNGDAKKAHTATQAAIDAGIAPMTLIKSTSFPSSYWQGER